VEHPVLAYSPASGQWIVTRRPWVFVKGLYEAPPRSGQVELTADRSQALGSGYWLSSDTACATWICPLLRGPNGLVALNARIAAAERRRINRALIA
jgi:hypothetical protein